MTHPTTHQLRDAKLDFTLRGGLATQLPPEITPHRALIEPRNAPQPIPPEEAGYSDYARKG